MRKRKIGFVFQKFNLLPTLDARSNITIAQKIAGNGDRDPAHFNRITDLLGLTKRLNHRPSELSGGEQQRVALAERSSTNQLSFLPTSPRATSIRKIPMLCWACCGNQIRSWGRPF